MNSSSFEGHVLDPLKCSKLSMEEKRELVYELSKWSHGAPEMLQSWSRQEILQILCAEMGKERKYTGLTKLRIIENLLKVVSEKKSQGHETATNLDQQSSPAVDQRALKRQRKTEHPNRLPAEVSNAQAAHAESDIGTVYCKNSACRAKLSQEVTFCKRCSCCICHQYDDNKDPSLWLTCSSDPPFEGNSCGMSCHLECALRHGKSGIAKNGMDGSFLCVSCRKVNDLLGCWRKQLMTAKETRRIDILCYRVSLSQKLLAGTKRYQKLYEIVDEAVQKLEAELGPLTGLPVKKARGIVNRLSSGPEVQRLCALAVESLQLMLSNTICHLSSNHMIQGEWSAGCTFQDLLEFLHFSKVESCRLPNFLVMQVGTRIVVPVKPLRLVLLITPLGGIRFEDVCSSSLAVILGSEGPAPDSVVGYTLWHREAEDMNYSSEPTCTLYSPSTRFLLSGLNPSTEYVLKVVCFDSTGELGTTEAPFRTVSAESELPNSKNVVAKRSESPASNSSNLSNPCSLEDETNNLALGINMIENRGNDTANIAPSINENTDKIVSSNLLNDVIDSGDMVLGGNVGDSASLLDDEGPEGKISSIPNSDVLNLENDDSPGGQTVEDTSTDNGSNTHVQTVVECVPFVGNSVVDVPITPCKLDKIKDGPGRKGKCKPSNNDLESGSGREEEPQAGSSSKKRSGERRDEENSGSGSRDFEYYVKVIRWLECEGHIETTFRQKFLTWYSLRATPQEVRVVKVFVDTLIDDPVSLAGQLVDSFSEAISSKRASVVPSGFCLKLWH